MLADQVIREISDSSSKSPSHGHEERAEVVLKRALTTHKSPRRRPYQEVDPITQDQLEFVACILQHIKFFRDMNITKQ